MTQRRLYRSRDDSLILGVCGGLGKYFGVDSNPIRLAFMVLAAWNGLGILLYLATVLIVPEEPPPESATRPGPLPLQSIDEARRVRMLGWLLVLGGTYLLLRNHPLFRPIVPGPVLPIILILGGVVLLLVRAGSRRG